MSIEEHGQLDGQNLKDAVRSVGNNAKITLAAGDFTLSMNKGRTTAHIEIKNKWNVKIIGSTRWIGGREVPATNVDIYGFDTGARDMQKNYVFEVTDGGNILIKNLIIRHGGDSSGTPNKHLHHSVASVTGISGSNMFLMMDEGFSPALEFFGEHFMHLS